MSSLDGISPISSAVPELRPELDRARLQTYQLAEVYNLQEARMITPIAYRDASDRLEAQDPLLYDAVPRRLDASASAVDPSERRPVDAVPPASESWAPAALRPDAPIEGNAARGGLSEAADAIDPVDSAEPPGLASGPAPLPYGADPGRIRQLVEAIVEGHAVVPLTFQYRQAGDLVPVKPAAPSAIPAVPRTVASVYRTF